ncbi:MAG: helix-turn-helix transcriptional regulator [Geobacteraceae bacterium]
METERLLTPSEVQKIVRVSASTLNRWRKQNIILSWIKIGRSVRYKESDVKLLLEVTGGGNL